MIRKAASLKKIKIIEWRSHEPSRLETFSDAVFAFAVTPIIVSLEVPKPFYCNFAFLVLLPFIAA